jgi:hypothetical protein
VVHLLDSSVGLVLVSELNEAIALVHDDVGAESGIELLLEKLQKLVCSACV